MVTPDGRREYWAEVAEEKRRLREGLTRREMSMARFASLCGCSPSNVSAYLRHEFWRLPRYMWRAAVECGLV